MKPRVFVSRPIPETALSILEKECSVEMWHSSTVPPPISEKIRNVDGLLTYGHETVSREMMLESKRLKVISVLGVGYDHVDVEAATELGILVGNTPEILAGSAADLTFALLLAVARNIVPANHYVRTGQWTELDPSLFWGEEVHGSTLGIVGMGAIGRGVARRASGFSMKTIYFKRKRREDWESELGIQYASLSRLLRESDFVTLHLPLTTDTHHFIGRDELREMKSTAYLINVARGPVVDPDALYEALQSRQIAGAALDVTEPEPLPVDHPLLDLDNLLITPHIGTATRQTRHKMAELAVQNLLAGLKGEPLLAQVLA
ncbi:MAG TPA: D-glycerate dehydrogenase [Acidobacteriota bacterium]|nr:D-glycerate dehydrogenase [Acidobacteriota bacterium]